MIYTWLQIAIYMVLLVALAIPLGQYMANVYMGESKFARRVFGPIEGLIYKLGGVNPSEEMPWKRYALALLLFNAMGLLVVWGLQMVQHRLPLNPQALGAVPWHLALNTAISFTTNTNWQAYGGEVTMSYLVQMLALTVQNFLSAATGMAVLVALARGFSRKSSGMIGNFWVDMTRTTVSILLPLSAALALVLVTQGVVQTFSPSVMAAGLDSAAQSGGQTLAMGPAASQIAIKQLGTNGGGFFNVNSAHPFENPTPLSNLLEVLAILLIPAALCFTFGRMQGNRKHARALLIAMFVVLIPMVLTVVSAEQAGNPLVRQLGVDDTASALQSGGNMEGKEVRFGSGQSALWSVVTTAASNGSVNSMHDSYTPLGGLVPIWMMQLGEIIFGGVGSGLYGILLYAILAVFLAGLMVGRTPEYLGKKIEAFEVKMASLGILLPSILVLVGTAVSVVVADGLAGRLNPGAHGFSEILYAWSSAGNNNGSAFAGLTANTVFYDLGLGLAMLIGRFGPLLAVLAIAGSLAAKKTIPETAGTLPTHGPLFIGLLTGVILLVGALTFLPTLALGPIVEHIQMTR